MAIFLKDANAIFLHIPKCGGTWVQKILNHLNVENYGVMAEDFNYKFGMTQHHHIPTHIPQWKNGTKFTFVREPAKWYQSYFAYRQINGWEPESHIIDKFCAANLFTVFIDKVINRFGHGYASKLMEMFTMHSGIVGKSENLEKSFFRIMNIFGYKVSLDEIKSFGKINVTDSHIYEYGPGQKDLIKQIDRSIYEKYYRELL